MAPAPVLSVVGSSTPLSFAIAASTNILGRVRFVIVMRQVFVRQLHLLPWKGQPSSEQIACTSRGSTRPRSRWLDPRVFFICLFSFLFCLFFFYLPILFYLPGSKSCCRSPPTTWCPLSMSPSSLCATLRPGQMRELVLRTGIQKLSLFPSVPRMKNLWGANNGRWIRS